MIPAPPSKVIHESNAQNDGIVYVNGIPYSLDYDNPNPNPNPTRTKPGLQEGQTRTEIDQYINERKKIQEELDQRVNTLFKKKPASHKSDPHTSSVTDLVNARFVQFPNRTNRSIGGSTSKNTGKQRNTMSVRDWKDTTQRRSISKESKSFREHEKERKIILRKQLTSNQKILRVELKEVNAKLNQLRGQMRRENIPLSERNRYSKSIDELEKEQTKLTDEIEVISSEILMMDSNRNTF